MFRPSLSRHLDRMTVARPRGLGEEGEALEVVCPPMATNPLARFLPSDATWGSRRGHRRHRQLMVLANTVHLAGSMNVRVKLGNLLR